MEHLQEFQDYVQDVVDVVEFKLIRNKNDLENDNLIFRPLMAHQIFGENESIFGYQDLRVRIYYTAGPLHMYVGIKYSAKVDDIANGSIKADNAVSIIGQALPADCYFVNMDEFLKTLDKADKFQPFGEKLTEFKSTDAEGKERHFEIYNCNYKVSAFLKFFGRLQTFILWFIDAASYIDVDDMQWNYFVCYEKYKNDDGEYQYATTGYTTIYEYYAYPQNIRPRISQMLVLPPFQKLGIATKFIETVYKFYQSQNNVRDITVEDPSDDFQRLRCCVDARLCMDLNSFRKDDVKKGFNKEMVREAREVLKLNPRQCRKIYEILRLYHTNVEDDVDYKAYRLEVKKRLNAVYHKQLNDIKKMERARVDTEWLRAGLPGVQQRILQLQEEYVLVESEYKKVVDKLRS